MNKQQAMQAACDAYNEAWRAAGSPRMIDEWDELADEERAGLASLRLAHEEARTAWRRAGRPDASGHQFTVKRHSVFGSDGAPLFLGFVRARSLDEAGRMAADRWGWCGVGGLVVSEPGA